MGLGASALVTSQKREPSGAPFTAGSAVNGTSIDALGRVVLGNDIGALLAVLVSNRAIPSAGFYINQFGGALVLSDTPAVSSGTLLDIVRANTGASAAGTLRLATTFNTTGAPTAVLIDITKTAVNASAVLVNIQQDGIPRLFMPVDCARATFNSDGIRIQSMSGTVGGISFNGSNTVGNAIITSAGFQMVNSDTISGVAVNSIRISGGVGLSVTPTSGTMALVQTGGNFTPTSGTAIASMQEVTGTINQTGGANGITRGLFVNPVVLAAADFRALEVVGGVYVSDTTMIHSTTGFANGAAAAIGTLLNAPVAGNPTKWIPLNDNGTIRYMPAW
jgi:hypothetical protein